MAPFFLFFFVLYAIIFRFHVLLVRNCFDAACRIRKNCMMSSTYSLWFIPLCLLAGAVYAFLLYGSRHGYPYPAGVRRTLFALRWLTVSLLCFLLLRPVVGGKVKEVEKPLLLFGIDNSESIALTKDSAFYRQEFPSKLRKLTENLSKDYQVEGYLIGDSVKRGVDADYTEKGSNLSRFFTMVGQRYPHRNVGAVVFVSDGIRTEGEDPLYAAKRLKYPIYTVALGDTTEVRDLRIAKTRCNRSVYKNNLFPMEILVQAHRLQGKRTLLQIKEKERVVYEKELAIRGSDYSEWVRLTLAADRPGHLHYKISLSPVEGEYTDANNHSDLMVQVIEECYKVAVVYRAPHPDVAALTESVRNNPMYQVETFPVEKFRPGEKSYDLYVLHQLPTATQPVTQLLGHAVKSGAGLLLFTGGFTDGEVRLPSECGLQINRDKTLENDAYPELNADFADFSLSNDFIRLLPDLPPLRMPFGTYTLSANASVCLYQKINHISTRYPLFYLKEGSSGKMAVLLGEGWWRWRIYNYLYEGSHIGFDHLMGQMLQYLVTKDDKSFFRVKGKELYRENEEICFDAEVYNKNYELDNQPEVRMQLVSEKDGGKHEFIFTRTRQAYRLNLGKLPEGNYLWTASVQWQGQLQQRKGRFYVQQVHAESLRLTADHQLMLNLAAINEGQMFSPDALNSLEKKLRSDERIKPLARYTVKRHPLLDRIGIFLLLALLLGGEWFVRKWSGNY